MPNETADPTARARRVRPRSVATGHRPGTWPPPTGRPRGARTRRMSGRPGLARWWPARPDDDGLGSWRRSSPSQLARHRRVGDLESRIDDLEAGRQLVLV